MSRLSRWLIAGVLGGLCSTGSGCRTSAPSSQMTLPPPVPLADGSQSYQVGPDHPLVQQAAAIRAAANAETR